MKGIVKDSFWYTIGSIGIKGVSFLLLPIFTTYLSTEDYGVLDMFMVFSTLSIILVGFEVLQALGRFLSNEKDEKNKAKYISTFLGFITCSYTLLFFVCWLSKPLIIEYVFDGIVDSNTFWLGIFSIITTGYVNNFLGIFRFTFRAKFFSLIHILQGLISFPVAILLMVSFNLTLEGYFIGMIVGNVSCLIISMLLNKEYLGLRIDGPILKKYLTYSSPLILSAAALVLGNYIDRLFIKSMLTMSDLGIYGFAFRLSTIVVVLKSGFIKALAPVIYRDYKEKKTPNQLAYVFKVYAFIGAFICFAYILFSHELVHLIAGDPSFYESYSLIPIMALMMVLQNITIFIPGVNISKQTKYIAIIQIVYLIINVILNYILIPKYGLRGAAIATTSSGFLAFLINYKISQRFYFIPHDVKRLSAVLMFVVLGIVYFWFGESIPVLNNMDIFIRILIKTVLLSILGIVTFFIVLSIKDIKRMKNLMLIKKNTSIKNI